MSPEFLILLLQILRIVTVVLIFCILAYIGYIMASFKNEIPFVPTPKKIAKKMAQLAGLLVGDSVIDLGSGTGRLVIAAAREQRDCTVVGVERSLVLRFATRCKLVLFPALQKRISIINQDFYTIDLTPYAVIFCFITPDGFKALMPKFMHLQTGKKIVTYMFPLPSTEGFSETVHQVNEKDNIYVYIKQ